MSVEQLLQFSSGNTTLKQKLNSGEIHATRASRAYYNKLNFFNFSSRIGLSIGGKITWKCDCRHPWVKPRKVGEITVWHCERCNAPRLAQRRKSDQELIAELLASSDLKGWEKLFTREMQRKERLSTCQREKLQGIAQRLGVRLEENCSLSDVEGVGQ